MFAFPLFNVSLANQAFSGPKIKNLRTGELIEIVDPDSFTFDAEMDIESGLYIYCTDGVVKMYQFRLSEALRAGLKTHR